MIRPCGRSMGRFPMRYLAISRKFMTIQRAGFVCVLLSSFSMLSAAIPNEPAKESAHPPSIVLWPNGAPGSEARKGEPEKLDWRDEPENNIVFPVLFNVHNPSITPFI